MENENELLKRIKDKDEFTEDELSDLVSIYSIDRKEIERGRWDISIQSIIELNGELFAIDWLEGATENQPCFFWNQPYKVEIIKRIIEITEYQNVEEE